MAHTATESHRSLNNYRSTALHIMPDLQIAAYQPYQLLSLRQPESLYGLRLLQPPLQARSLAIVPNRDPGPPFPKLYGNLPFRGLALCLDLPQRLPCSAEEQELRLRWKIALNTPDRQSALNSIESIHFTKHPSHRRKQHQIIRLRCPEVVTEPRHLLQCIVELLPQIIQRCPVRTYHIRPIGYM